MKLAVSIHVMSRHLQYCSHYGNSINGVLGQSPEFLFAGNLNAFSASIKY